MNISTHEQNNAFYCGQGAGTTPWAHGFTVQQLVTPAIVTATGGTYALEAPEVEEKPKRVTRPKK